MMWHFCNIDSQVFEAPETVLIHFETVINGGSLVNARFYDLCGLCPNRLQKKKNIPSTTISPTHFLKHHSPKKSLILIQSAPNKSRVYTLSATPCNSSTIRFVTITSDCLVNSSKSRITLE